KLCVTPRQTATFSCGFFLTNIRLCKTLKARVEHAEELNRDLEALGEKPFYRIDPDAYKALEACRIIHKIKRINIIHGFREPMACCWASPSCSELPLRFRIMHEFFCIL